MSMTFLTFLSMGKEDRINKTGRSQTKPPILQIKKCWRTDVWTSRVDITKSRIIKICLSGSWNSADPSHSHPKQCQFPKGQKTKPINPRASSLQLSPKEMNVWHSHQFLFSNSVVAPRKEWGQCGRRNGGTANMCTVGSCQMDEIAGAGKDCLQWANSRFTG